MRLGLTMFVTDRSIGPVELARAAEERGFDSIFFPEHTHIPTSRRTPCPTGEPIAEEYKRPLDPFVALSAAAAVTSRIRIGTGVCLVAQRDPIVLAKEVATLDLISGGRFVFGIGFGWNVEEMEHHGVDFRRRRELVREKVLAMRELWRKEEAGFEGELVRFEKSWSWPKPLQQPHPAILIGGAAGPKMFRHIAEYADGWIPIGGAGIKAALPELHRALEEVGRRPSEVEIVPFGTIPDRGKLDYYASLGIREVVLRLPSAPASKVIPLLDQMQSWVTSHGS